MSRAQLEATLKAKADERARVVALFRRSRITEAELDSQLDEISAEEESLRLAIAEVHDEANSTARTDAFLASAGALLTQLRHRLDQGVSWELKRELINILVGQIRVECAHKGDRERPLVRITYRFPEATVTCTDTRACNCCSIEKAVSLPDPRLPTQIRTIGDRIRYQRLQRGLTQTEVAEAIGVTETALGHWESNKRTPSLRFLPLVTAFVRENGQRTDSSAN